jgi:putative aldouronate transport system permease protein
MIEKLTPSRVVFNILNYGFMIMLCIVCLAPVWHVIMASLSDPRTLLSTRGLLRLPVGKATLEGYSIVLNNPSILTGYRNTIIYVICTVFVGISLLSIGGYVLSRKSGLQMPFTLLVVFTMLFSGGLIPSVVINMQLGLMNNPLALIIPGSINAFYLIIMKNAFQQIPASLEESAKLDGAGPFTIMLRIMMPLVKATIAVMVMFIIIQQWNSWMPASIYLPRNRNMWPLQLFMREILVQNDTKMISASEAASMADLVNNLVKHCVTVVGTLPILLLYPFVQKYFVKGVTLGSVKG